MAEKRRLSCDRPAGELDHLNDDIVSDFDRRLFDGLARLFVAEFEIVAAAPRIAEIIRAFRR